MRKLATIRKIDDIRPIDGADAIECAIIGGWTVVVKKGEFAVGQFAVYLEIDSFVPNALAPFLTKAGHFPKTYSVTNEDGTVTTVEGERLKTIRLRGQLSQGLLLPMSGFDAYFEGAGDTLFKEGDDVTNMLGILKWERAIPAQLAGLARGNFPTAIPKTDQERAQNLVKEITAVCEIGKMFEITEKLEGSSMTCYLIDGQFGVCSRNLDLKCDENNSFWATAIREDIEAKMRLEFGETGDFAIQGELIGPGIQNNIYNLTRTEFYVFDIYDIRRGEYLRPSSRRLFVDAMELNHAPVLAYTAELYDTLGLQGVQDILKFAEGPSKLNKTQEREGVVFKQVDGGMSFKAVSNRYLMKGGE
jgi:RNA ligase (TIGR02306 family)